MEAVHVIIVTDADSGHEALYVGGDLKEQDVTIYGCEIARHVQGLTIQFSHVSVRMPVDVHSYPEKFEQCMLWKPVEQD
jgi:hypothetical protein